MKMNNIQTMMKDDTGVHNINESVAEYKAILVEFKACQKSIQRLSVEDDRENETLH